MIFRSEELSCTAQARAALVLLLLRRSADEGRDLGAGLSTLAAHAPTKLTHTHTKSSLPSVTDHEIQIQKKRVQAVVYLVK